MWIFNYGFVTFVGLSIPRSLIAYSNLAYSGHIGAAVAYVALTAYNAFTLKPKKEDRKEEKKEDGKDEKKGDGKEVRKEDKEVKIEVEKEEKKEEKEDGNVETQKQKKE